LDPDIARNIADKHGIDDTDVGIWIGDFALLFNPEKQTSLVKTRMVFPDDPEYFRCLRYFHEVSERAEEISEDLPLFSNDLTYNWQEFIVPEKRLLLEEPFLEHALNMVGVDKERCVILDAAMGIGVETVLLLKEKCTVFSNEIEKEFIGLAKKYANEHGVDLRAGHINQRNWLEFSKHFENESFNVVLVLGNSIALLADPSEIKKTLIEFHTILLKDGILVIDERNFQQILDEWDFIMEDPWNNFDYSRKVMYCSDKVQACPKKKVNKDHVVLTYAHTDGKEVGDTLGELTYYALKKGELFSLLRDAGFSDIKIYSDLDKDSGVENPDEVKTKADFYTYICRK